MPEFDSQDNSHRKINRYQCPPFFEAIISGGELSEQQAKVENLSICGLSIRSDCEFVPGSMVRVVLRSTYVGPVKLLAKVQWISPEDAESVRLVGLTICRAGLLEWFKYRRILKRLKKELW